MRILKIGAFVVDKKEEKEIRDGRAWDDFGNSAGDKKIVDFFKKYYLRSGINYIPIGWQRKMAMNNGDIIVLKELLFDG